MGVACSMCVCCNERVGSYQGVNICVCVCVLHMATNLGQLSGVSVSSVFIPRYKSARLEIRCADRAESFLRIASHAGPVTGLYRYRKSVYRFIISSDFKSLSYTLIDNYCFPVFFLSLEFACSSLQPSHV